MGQIVKSNLLTYFNLIFAILAILVIAVGSFRSLTFLPVVVANLFIGILQEIRAKKTLDQLALKEADCSVAMASGCDAAAQVSQLVLLESDFFAMPSVVAEGRRVVNNIQRSASLFLVKNIFLS